MLAKTRIPTKIRKSQVDVELSKRAKTKGNVGLSLNKEMSDSEIHNAMLSKLFSVRKELGLA